MYAYTGRLGLPVQEDKVLTLFAASQIPAQAHFFELTHLVLDDASLNALPSELATPIGGFQFHSAIALPKYEELGYELPMHAVRLPARCFIP
jgi:hypothetical protein